MTNNLLPIGMEPYIKQKLYNVIREVYYKEYNNLGRFENNIEFLKKMFDNININDFETKVMIEDLIDIEENELIRQPTSILVNEIINTIKDAEKRVEKQIEKHPEINTITKLLYKNSYDEIMLVGGFVRDAIIGIANKDIDIVTNIPYDEIINRLSIDKNIKIKECGKKFLVMNIVVNNKQIEIANFRKDGTYIDGRRPDGVEIGTIDDDANRRDFTVNAMYYDLILGELLDPTGQAFDDILHRTLRFVGNAEKRLQEDYLRLFRALRFANKKGFIPTSKTRKELRTHFPEAIKKTDPMRILNEFINCGWI
jgi:hypothetical protein